MEKHSFEDWINRLADKNGCVELADNTEVIKDIGYNVLFKYPDREVQEFIFHHRIQN